MAIKTIEILNVMVFKRQMRKKNADFKTIKEGDSFNDGFKLDFCDGINVLIGDNGVGKTTILKMIYAVNQADGSGKNKKISTIFFQQYKR